jgi:hypothetical protein
MVCGAAGYQGVRVNVNKRYIASLCIASSTLVGKPFRRGAPPRKKGSAFCFAHAGKHRGAAKTMKLFQTAFWLSVVIYNLPSPASQPAAPESQLNDSQGLAAKAAGRFCPQPCEPCAKNIEALPERGDQVGHSSSRGAVMRSHDTLTPADRAVPWRGRALRNQPPATRSEVFLGNAGRKI